jgi:hypothetical protein
MRTAHSAQRTANSEQRTANSEQRTARSEQHTLLDHLIPDNLHQVRLVVFPDQDFRRYIF